jgi:hypothetical protein
MFLRNRFLVSLETTPAWGHSLKCRASVFEMPLVRSGPPEKPVCVCASITGRSAVGLILEPGLGVGRVDQADGDRRKRDEVFHFCSRTFLLFVIALHKKYPE